MKKTYKRIITLGADKAPHFWTIGENGTPKDVSDLAAEIAADLEIRSGTIMVTVEAEEQEYAYAFNLENYEFMRGDSRRWRLCDMSGRSIKIIDTEFENDMYPVVAKRRDDDGMMKIYRFTSDGICETAADEDTLILLVPADEAPADEPKAPDKEKPAQQQKPADPAPQDIPDAKPVPEQTPAGTPATSPAPAQPQGTLPGFDNKQMSLKRYFQRLEKDNPGIPMEQLLEDKKEEWAKDYQCTKEYMIERYKKFKSLE